ncbi:hypothetical protein [Gordonia sp. UBA7860]|uniref:hypothetical protein n=1 Tax=Gordonia sp. UBA7860 TaxID=1946579 RepID=UPI00257F9ED2|nr:hypothetical protein [Gordonia sp. UBA7860]
MTDDAAPVSEPEPAKYRRPTQPPPADAAANLAAWDLLLDNSIERATATAEKWRAGLAGFIALITSLLIIKGPDAQKIPAPWIYVLVIAFAAGIVLAIIGLWKAQSASSPGLDSVDYTEVIKKYGSIRTYSVAVAIGSADKITTAKRFVAGALIALGVGVVAWWLVPASEPQATEQVRVTLRSGATLCGKITETAPAAGLPLKLSGTQTTIRVPVADLLSVTSVADCGS